jgi:Fe-S-cluster containining protein
VRDGPLLSTLKTLVRWAWTVEYGLRRAVRRRFGPKGYALAGRCGGCARCCEQPTIRAGLVTWYFPLLRAAFLAWQRRVNGFELVEADPDARLFLFRCTHFDWVTRRCDSYASRPFMCRDYPRGLLEQPWPELFPGCGYRPLARDADGLREALARTDLPPEKRAELERKLYLR